MPLFGYQGLRKDHGCAVTDYGMLMPIFDTIDQLKDPAMELRRNGTSGRWIWLSTILVTSTRVCGPDSSWQSEYSCFY
jgi:hypothetical protein